VHLTDLALTVLSEQRGQRNVDRYPLGEKREPLPAQFGVDARLQGTRLPTFGRAVATATPNAPVSRSRAVMEKV